MTQQSTSKKRRRVLRGLALVLFLMIPACQSDETTSNDTPQDTGADADINRDISDTPSPTKDAAPDIAQDTSPETDTSPDPHKSCIEAATGRMGAFRTRNSSRGLNTARLSIPKTQKNSDSPLVPCGAVALLNTEDPQEATSLDTRVYPKSQVLMTNLDGNTVVIASHHSFTTDTGGRWVIGNFEGITVDTFQIRNDSFERLNRVDDPFAGTLPGNELPVDFNPLELISYDNSAWLIGENKIIEFGEDPVGNFTAKSTYDRSSQIRNIEQQINAANPDPRDTIYQPTAGNHHVTDDGYLFEFEHGLAIWDLDELSSSDRDTVPLVSFLPIPGNEHPGIPSIFGDWAYSPAEELVYLGDSDTDEESPSAARNIEIIDVSDRTSPSIVATWDPVEDFSVSIDSSNTQDLHIQNDRLFILYEHRDNRFFRVMAVLDLSNTPTQVDELATIENFGVSGEPFSIYPNEDRLYLSSGTTRSSRIRWIKQSELHDSL